MQRNNPLRAGDKKNNKLLVSLLIAMISLIIVLTTSNVIISKFKHTETPVSTSSLPSNMDGYDGPISPSTSALILSQNISTKMAQDPDYTYEDAINDFETAFNSAQNDKEKLFITIEYADFIYRQTEDIDKALEILDKQKDLPKQEDTANSYYSAYYHLYSYIGDIEKMEYYEKLTENDKPGVTITAEDIVKLMEGAEE